MQLAASMRISVKPYKGKAFLLELIDIGQGRCMIRRDGTRSKKISTTTPTQIGLMLGRYVSAELPKAAMRRFERQK